MKALRARIRASATTDRRAFPAVDSRAVPQALHLPRPMRTRGRVSDGRRPGRRASRGAAATARRTASQVSRCGPTDAVRRDLRPRAPTPHHDRARRHVLRHAKVSPRGPTIRHLRDGPSGRRRPPVPTSSAPHSLPVGGTAVRPRARSGRPPAPRTAGPHSGSRPRRRALRAPRPPGSRGARSSLSPTEQRARRHSAVLRPRHGRLRGRSRAPRSGLRAGRMRAPRHVRPRKAPRVSRRAPRRPVPRRGSRPIPRRPAGSLMIATTIRRPRGSIPRFAPRACARPSMGTTPVPDAASMPITTPASARGSGHLPRATSGPVPASRRRATLCSTAGCSRVWWRR